MLIEAENREKIEKNILDYVGVLGWAKAAPFFAGQKEGKFILAISRESLNDVRSAFELSKENIKILKVSGTIKGLDK